MENSPPMTPFLHPRSHFPELLEKCSEERPTLSRRACPLAPSYLEDSVSVPQILPHSGSASLVLINIISTARDVMVKHFNSGARQLHP